MMDCFDVFEKAHQSRTDTLRACCTGVFDERKRNVKGWVWHADLDLYVDKSKCKHQEMREILIEKLKIDQSSSPDSIDQDEKLNKSSEKEKITRSTESKRVIIRNGADLKGTDLSDVVYTYSSFGIYFYRKRSITC